MMSLPSFNPLATAGAPLASIIVVVGAPAAIAVGLALGVLALAFCAATLGARRGKGGVAAPRRVRAHQVAMPNVAAGGAR